MPQSYAKIYIHLVFGTKYRVDRLRNDDLPRLYAYMAKVLHTCDCIPIRIGGTTNHVHILMLLGRMANISKVAGELKRNTSLWLKMVDSSYETFAWQEGYGAFSVSHSIAPKAISYIENQQEHHRYRTFAEEVRELFARHEMIYDERDWML